jgi:type VI secretion system protein VasD
VTAHRFSWFGIVGCLVCCAGATPATEVPAAACALPIQVALEASERINPNEQGVALPTSVRIYQLKWVARMEESDFAAVWETPKQALAEDLLNVQDFTLFPSKLQQVAVELSPETNYLAGVAIFRQPTGTQWRSIVALPPSPSLCAAYAKSGAPTPAVTFRFDQYRVEARSRLLSNDGEHELPADVAPLRTSQHAEHVPEKAAQKNAPENAR